jgi:hypothetical protein
VIKTAAYFPSQCALNSQPVIAALLSSLTSNGVTVAENSMTADAAIIWSALWSGRMQSNRTVYQQYRNSGRPVIVVDVGTLHRGITWKIAVNHVNASGYYGHTQNLDFDRPRKLGIKLDTSRALDPSIVIAAQHSRSLQLESVSQEQWILDKIAQIQSVTNRPIVVRPHPRCRLQPMSLPQNVRLAAPKKIIGTYDSYDINYNCHAVINYNSGPGIQAAIAGTRPIVDTSSLAHPASIDIVNIEQPYTVDRTQWLTEICHTEYTVEEIKQGLWLKRIQHAL